MASAEEQDPIHDEQLAIVEGLLGRHLTPPEYQGFLITGNRFVDRFGNTRIGDLAKTFETHRPEGRAALAASLASVAKSLGSYDRFAAEYPVTIVPPLPAFPLFPIIGIEQIRPVVYRVLRRGHPSLPHILAAGRLPPWPRPLEPVLRTTPQAHWCAYEKWPTPDETRKALQIQPHWSDCEIRATVATSSIADSAFVAYSVDPNDQETKGLHFHGYFFEGLTQDHDELSYPGEAVQICVYGEPVVVAIEEWDATAKAWRAL